MQALNGGRRLVAHHANVLNAQLHSFVLLALPSVEALRSTTSRTGMLMLQVGYMAHYHYFDIRRNNILLCCLTARIHKIHHFW